MEENIVKVEGLSHRYGRDWAIRDISFSIRQTGILGLLGSNGAGKSTTMNIMCGVLNQTSGEVTIGGVDLRMNPEEAKRMIGFLPQNAPLYHDLTVDEYLRHCALIRKIERKKVRQAVDAVKERCGVAHFSSRLIRNLSGGYRQRVGIAQAIIHRPSLVVLDEPTNGLDPNQILEVRSLIREIALDRAVIFSTHILSEVQVLCQEIRMIEGGKMVFAGSMDSFHNYIEPRSLLVWLDNPPDEKILEQITGVTRVEFQTRRQIRLYFRRREGITEEIIRTSIRQGWSLQEITLDKSSLDDVFAKLSGKA